MFKMDRMIKSSSLTKLSEFFIVTHVLYKLIFTLDRRKGLAKTQHKHSFTRDHLTFHNQTSNFKCLTLTP